MGLPKNFSEINKENRQKALDDLKWFIFYYDYELTEEFSEFVRVSYDWGHPVENIGSHRCYADTEEKALIMFHEYIDTSLIKRNKLTSYQLRHRSCDDGTCGITLVME